jgi:hypothetical protein
LPFSRLSVAAKNILRGEYQIAKGNIYLTHQQQQTPTTMNTYRLLSTPMVHTPGIVAWAINAYRFPKDRKVIRKVMESYPGLPAEIIDGLLSKVIPYKVEGETVIIIH